MDWIEEQLAHAPTPNTIIHLGAGLCSELETYQRYDPNQICLVEPNPEVLPELRRRTAIDERVSVLPVAVSGKEGRRSLKLFNYPDLCSLRQPTGLAQLLPGLRQTGQAIVDVIAAHILPDRLQLKGDENNWLFIDAPGEEFAIIESLVSHEQLHHFDRIILKAGAECLYEGARSAEDIVTHLQRLGYSEEGAPDNSDADWPRLHFRLNPKALECRRLERENRNLQEQLDQEKERFESQINHLQMEKQDLGRQCMALKASLQELQQTHDDLKKQFQGEFARLKDEKKELEQHSVASDSYESMKEELNVVRAQAERHRRDLGIALRLQALRESDLKELQERFGELKRVKNQQQELLGKLHERLSVAAEYLHLESDGSNPEDVRAELARAFSGEQTDSK